MQTFLILFILAWLIAPVILGIICIAQHNRIVKLERMLDGRDKAPAQPMSCRYPDKSGQQAPVMQQYTPPSRTVPAPAPDCKHNQPDAGAEIANHPNANNRPNAVNIILILGSAFITLAGFVFAAATWGTLNTFFKSAVLLSFSAVFFLLHFLAKHKLGLEATGKVFYTLASTFIPAGIAAAGILKVFGDYLSFSGEGRLLLITLMSALPAVCFFKGAHDYKSKSYARAAYSSSLCALLCLINFAADGTAAAAAMAVCSIAAVLLTGIIVSDKTVIRSEFSFFSVGCTWISAAVSLFLSEADGLFIIPTIMFSAAFFLEANRRSRSSAGTCACAAYLMTGAFLGIRPDSFDGVILVAALVMIVYTCLSLMNVIPEQIKSTAAVIRLICAGAILVTGVIGDMSVNGVTNGVNISILIAALALAVQLAAVCLSDKSKSNRIMLFVSLLWVGMELLKAFTVNSETGIYTYVTLLAAYTLALYLITRFTDKKLGFYCVGLSAGCCIMMHICIAAIVIVTIICDDCYPSYSAAVIAIAVAGCMTAGTDNLFGRISLPVIVSASVFPIFQLMYSADMARFGSVNPNDTALTAIAVTAVVYSAAAALTLIKPLRIYTLPFETGSVAAAGICLAVTLSTDGLPFFGLAALTLLSAVMMVYNRFGGHLNAYTAYFLSLLCITAFDTGRTLLFIEQMSLMLPAVVLLVVFAVYILPSIKGTDAENALGSFLTWALPIYAPVSMLAAEGTESYVPIIMAWVLTACGCAVSFMRNRPLLISISLCVMYPATHITIYGNSPLYSPNSSLAVIIAIAAAASILGRVINPKKSICKCYDFLGVTAPAAAVMLMAEGDDKLPWTGLFIGALMVLNLYRRENSRIANSVILTLSALHIFPVWNFQPFFEPPEVIALEAALLPVAVICILLRLIHREHENEVSGISFAAAVICLVILFFDAADTGLAADGIILGAVILLILGGAFMLRQKRWFVLAVVSAAAEAILLTLRLWDSRYWWLYLLAAGVILTAAGMANELNRKKTGSKSKLALMLDDWKW